MLGNELVKWFVRPPKRGRSNPSKQHLKSVAGPVVTKAFTFSSIAKEEEEEEEEEEELVAAGGGGGRIF
jgi:hypothetical protein